MKFNPRQYVLPLLVAFSCLVTVLLIRHYTHTHRPEAMNQQKVAAKLRSALSTERSLYNSTQAYTSNAQDAGLSSSPQSPWLYDVLAIRLEKRQALLLEARSDSTVIFMNESGELHKSKVKPLPPLPPWRPTDRPEEREADEAIF